MSTAARIAERTLAVSLARAAYVRTQKSRAPDAEQRLQAWWHAYWTCELELREYASHVITTATDMVFWQHPEFAAP